MCLLLVKFVKVFGKVSFVEMSQHHFYAVLFFSQSGFENVRERKSLECSNDEKGRSAEKQKSCHRTKKTIVVQVALGWK